jgi:transposase
MHYLAIDQHAKQLTVNLRNEEGTVILRRQVSTQPAKVREFFAGLRDQLASEGGYLAILEVCGFNDWLLKLLPEYGCRETVLVQCTDRQKNKTDRRDADRLGEMLWVNRLRIQAHQRVQNLRRVQPASPEDAAARQLTSLRQSLGRQRTRVLNRISALLKKHNRQHDCPTKGMQTKAVKQWLASLPLGDIDRFEMDQLLARWELFNEQIAAVQTQIAAYHPTHPTAACISSVPGLKGYAGLAIAARIGNVQRFPRPASLVNFFGLAPSCRNSGESGQRLGGITKQGSPIVRFLLGLAVLHVLRSDPVLRSWYKKVKARRGSKIARVAVMRRIVVAIWHMLKHGEPYRPGGSPARRAAGQRSPRSRTKARVAKPAGPA